MGRIFAVPPSPFEVDHYPAILAGLRYEAEHGTLPDAPAWRALERRHEINPARFQHWHPNISLMIERQHVPGPVVELGALTAQPEPPAVASVPEPSSLALTCVAVAALYIVIGWQNRRLIEAQARDAVGWIERRMAK